MGDKKIKMASTAKEFTSKAQQKLSYEELESAVNQLMQVNNQMRKLLQQQDYGNFHQRMAYLFEVVRNSDKFTDAFVKECIHELELTLTLPKKEGEDLDGKEEISDQE